MVTKQIARAEKLLYCDQCGKSVWQGEFYTHREDMTVGISWDICAVCEPMPSKQCPLCKAEFHFAYLSRHIAMHEYSGFVFVKDAGLAELNNG